MIRLSVLQLGKKAAVELQNGILSYPQHMLVFLAQICEPSGLSEAENLLG